MEGPWNMFSCLSSVCRVESEHSTDLGGRYFTNDPQGRTLIDDDLTLKEAGLGNGDMIYINVDEEKTGVHEDSQTGKFVTKDGNIIAVDHAEVANKTGFRPGTKALRDMKMHWTLQEFESLDSQFTFRLKKAEDPVCKIVSLDQDSLNNFQSYVRNFDFRRTRIGFLYGHFTEDNGVQAHFIYEPAQDADSTTFRLLQTDEDKERVEAVAAHLGVRQVGWVIAHPPREEGFFLSGEEVITAAELQLEAAGGVEDTPFVTVSLTITQDGSDVVACGYQVSKMCMEMAAEDVLDVSPHLGMCAVKQPFTAIMEGKEASEVDNNFFIASVPIESWKTNTFVSLFPRQHRDGVAPPASEDLRVQLERAGKQGWSLVDMLADFNLLLFLTNFLDIQHDLPLVCRSIIDRSIPLDEGYVLLIRSLAGMDM